MTHLSDYSYIDRGLSNYVFLLYILFRYYRVDPTFETFRRFNLKSACAGLLVASLLFGLVYDTIATLLKYAEGFSLDPTRGCITKPTSKWTDNNTFFLFVADWMFSLSMTTKTSCCFLITAFFNHLSQSIVKGGFMSSREFKAYQAYGIFSLIAYPVLTAPLQRIDQLMSAILPQLFYSTECMILIGLCLYNNYRLKRLVKNASGKGTIQNKSSERISFYLLANNLMAICLFVEGISLYIINIDIITTRIIYQNKFVTDIFSKTFSLGFACCYPLIFHMLFLAPQADGPVSAQAARKSGSHMPVGTGQVESTIGVASETQSAVKMPANQTHTKFPPRDLNV